MKKAKKKITARYIDLDKEIIFDKSGSRITESRARSVSQEVLNEVVGRPSLTGAGKESPEIKARVPLKLKKSLLLEAKRQGKTSSELIREALEKFLRSA